MPLPLKHFYMIRHGETKANAARIMAGSMDSPLNETGRAQAFAVQPILRELEIKPKVIVHSHLSRARDTAGILNEVLGVPMHEEPDVAEIHCGEWEGKLYDECIDLFENTDHTPEGGESFNQFKERIKRGKSKALETHDTPPLIVCHGGVFRAMAKMYNYNIFGTRNCHLHEFIPNPENTRMPWTIHSYNHDGKVIKTEIDWAHVPARWQY